MIFWYFLFALSTIGSVLFFILDVFELTMLLCPLSMLFVLFGALCSKKRAQRKYQREETDEKQYQKSTRVRRIVSICLIVIALIPVSISLVALDQNGEFYWGYYLAYSKDEDACTITDVRLCMVKHMDIPETIDRYRVTSIGKGAFEFCNSLKSVTIPEGVQKIERSAFDFCRALTTVVIPGSVQEIEKNAFDSCGNLTSITVAESNATYHSENNCVIETESKTLIKGCKNSEIPTDGSVTRIGDYAFYHCDGLTSITIPDSVTHIGDFSFSVCRDLVDVTLSNNLKYIGGGAFGYCSSLESITIPESVTDIQRIVFEYCINLTEIIFEDTSDWYITDEDHYYIVGDLIIWSEGEEISVENPSTNATNFKETYEYYSWYKR